MDGAQGRCGRLNLKVRMGREIDWDHPIIFVHVSDCRLLA